MPPKLLYYSMLKSWWISRNNSRILECARVGNRDVGVSVTGIEMLSGDRYGNQALFVRAYRICCCSDIVIEPYIPGPQKYVTTNPKLLIPKSKIPKPSIPKM